MSHTDSAISQAHKQGAMAAITSLAGIDDLDEAATAYLESMKAAYWTDKNLPLVTAIAHAGVSRLLHTAGVSSAEIADDARTAAKRLMYNLASFTWIGWDEPGIAVGSADSMAGLAAARSGLSLTIELDKGDLEISRANWILGAHLLTADHHQEASASFEEALKFAELAGAQPEVELAKAFIALCDLAAGHDGASEKLATTLKNLGSLEDGDSFVEQVTTARTVMEL